ncbi:hypothetical protein ACT453_43515, partial [Bacillus sp. D-CC]
ARWRLDYDPEKGLHMNVEDFRNGKGSKSNRHLAFLSAVCLPITLPYPALFFIVPTIGIESLPKFPKRCSIG